MAEKAVSDVPKLKHPKYTVMVEEAIYSLQKRTGPSRQAITSFVKEKYQLDSTICGQHVNRALKECMEKNVIESSTDNLVGHFKLSQAKKEEMKRQEAAAKKAEMKTEKKQKTEAEKGDKKATKPPKNPAAKPKIVEDKENDENVATSEVKKGKASSKVDKATSSKAKKTDKDVTEDTNDKKKTLKRTNSASKLKTSESEKQTGKETSTKQKSKKKSKDYESEDQPEESTEKKPTQTSGRRGPRKKSSETN